MHLIHVYWPILLVWRVGSGGSLINLPQVYTRFGAQVEVATQGTTASPCRIVSRGRRRLGKRRDEARRWERSGGSGVPLHDDH